MLKLSLDVVDKAEQQFAKLESSIYNFKGRNIEGIAAAILYVASR